MNKNIILINNQMLILSLIAFDWLLIRIYFLFFNFSLVIFYLFFLSYSFSFQSNAKKRLIKNAFDWEKEERKNEKIITAWLPD